MKFIQTSIIGQVMQSCTNLKLKNTDRLKIYFESIDFSFILKLVSHLYSNKGAPAFHPISMFKAVMLIFLGEASSERDVSAKLKFDTRLQLLCNFDFFRTPSHSDFHYFRKRLGVQIFYEIFHNLIAQAISAGIINRFIDTTADSTHIWAYSNKFGIKMCQCHSKCNCLKKYSDPDANWGYKTKTFAFFGYKVHLIIDSKSQLPLEAMITKASVADNTVYPDLLAGVQRNHPELTIKSSIKDAAYDDTKIYQICQQKGIIPIIALNPANGTTLNNKKVKIDKKGNFFCRETGLKLVKNGHQSNRKNRLKLICPPTGERKNCPFRNECCPNSKVGKTFYIYPLNEFRLVGEIPRDSAEWKLYFNKRTSIERLWSELKTPKHKLHILKVRGHEKVAIHTFLSLCGVIIKRIGTGAGFG